VTEVTFGVDGANMLLIEDVENLFNLQDVCFGESWPLVGAGVEFGLKGLLLRLLIGSAHCSRWIIYYGRSILLEDDKI
jgi:hypothetical protein